MSDLVQTVVRFPKEDLNEYKALAAEMGISFSELVRRLLEDASGSLMFGGPMKARIKETATRPKVFNLGKYKKWAASQNRASVEHDRFIYGLTRRE